MGRPIEKWATYLRTDWLCVRFGNETVNRCHDISPEGSGGNARGRFRQRAGAVRVKVQPMRRPLPTDYWDMVERFILIPVRKWVRETLGRPDVSTTIEGISFGSFPIGTRALRTMIHRASDHMVVDLRTVEDRPQTGPPHVLRIPVPDGKIMPPEALSQLLSAIRVGQPREVTVYCRLGRNRSAMVTAGLLILTRGLPADVAIDRVRSSRRFVRILPPQVDWLQQISKRGSNFSS
jgi:rhodanese-related sulfurtransferase